MNGLFVVRVGALSCFDSQMGVEPDHSGIKRSVFFIEWVFYSNEPEYVEVEKMFHSQATQTKVFSFRFYF